MNVFSSLLENNKSGHVVCLVENKFSPPYSDWVHMQVVIVTNHSLL